MRDLRRFGSALVVVCTVSMMSAFAQSAGFTRQQGMTFTSGTPVLRYYGMSSIFRSFPV